MIIIYKCVLFLWESKVLILVVGCKDWQFFFCTFNQIQWCCCGNLRVLFKCCLVILVVFGFTSIIIGFVRICVMRERERCYYL